MLRLYSVKQPFKGVLFGSGGAKTFEADERVWCVEDDYADPIIFQSELRLYSADRNEFMRSTEPFFLRNARSASRLSG